MRHRFKPSLVVDRILASTDLKALASGGTTAAAIAHDKRSLVLLERPLAFDRWLEGTVDDARALMRLTPVETLAAGPGAPDEVLVA